MDHPEALRPPPPAERTAVDRGELDATTDPAQLAFELNAIGMAANWHHQLLGGPTFATAGAAWATALRRAEPDPRPSPTDP